MIYPKLILLCFFGLAHAKVSNEPLFLTQYISKGAIDEARSAALVGPLPNAPNVTSYSGYLTVNNTTGSNIFFWFFPSQNKNAPLALWLQGGPGAASTYAIFNEIGPFVLDADLNVSLRKYSWHNLFSYLYIDQPVGTGFSFTQSDAGYVRDQQEVARDLYIALEQFFTLFPDQKPNDFYITGESYAGKYIPSIGAKLHQEREHSGINFKGVAIGDGVVDGALMLRYSDILFNTGLFSYQQAQQGRELEREIAKAAAEQRWIDCFYLQDRLLAGDRVPSFFTNVTGITNYFNSLETIEPVDTTYSDRYLALDEVKSALHIGNRSVSSGDAVYNHLLQDFCKSVKPELEILLENDYEVLLYSGSLDIVVGVACTERLLQALRWKDAQSFAIADRKIWKLAGDNVNVAGFITSYKNFHYVVVRGAGHMVPHDQPKAAYEMITRYLKRKL